MKVFVALLLCCVSLVAQKITTARHAVIKDTDPLYTALGIKFDPVVRVHFQTDSTPSWPGVDIIVSFSDSTKEMCNNVKFTEVSGWFTVICSLSSTSRVKTITQVQVATPPPPPVTSTVIALSGSPPLNEVDKTVVIDAITQSSVRIQYKTSVEEPNYVAYGLTPQYGGEARSPDWTKTKNHVWYISGLRPATLINFRVGITSQSSNFTFTTSAPRGPLPEAPRQFVDTKLPTQTGKRLVPDILCTNLQSIINSAVPGDTIALQKGSVCKGNYKFPPKQGNGWIVVETDGHNLQPNVQLGPITVKITNLARIQTPNADNAIHVQDNAHHYRFQAFELMPADEKIDSQCLAETSPSSHHVIFDRVYFHGWENGRAMRGVRLNGSHVAAINSRFDNLHWFDDNSPEGYGIEALAIVVDAASVLAFINNYVDVPGISIFIGTANIPTSPVEDIEVRGNYVKLSPKYMWSIHNPERTKRFAHRQLFETKCMRRGIIDGNIWELNFGDLVSAADVILFSSRPGVNHTVNHFGIQDIFVRNNLIRGGSGGIALNGHQGMDHPQASEAQVVTTQRIWMENNLFDRIDGYKYTTTNVDGAVRSNQRGKILTITEGAESITFIHNTIIDNKGTGPRWLAMLETFPSFGLDMSDNIFYTRNDFSAGGVKDGPRQGIAALNSGFTAFPDTSWRFEGNLAVDPPDRSPVDVEAINPKLYPSNTKWAKEDEVGFVDLAAGNYRLRPDSKFKGASGGKDPGADIDALEAALKTRVDRYTVE